MSLAMNASMICNKYLGILVVFQVYLHCGKVFI